MRAWPLLAIWILSWALYLPGASAGEEAWAALPQEMVVSLKRVVLRLQQAPFERARDSSRPGGLRRLAKDRPRDTVVGLYPSPTAAPGVVTWSREQVGQLHCQRGQIGVTVWMFATRPAATGNSGLIWAAGKLDTCVDPAHSTPPAGPTTLSTNDRTVRALAAAILHRLGE